MLFYPDELLVPSAPMRLGRPVKWTEDRQEHFTAVNQERGQVHEVEVGFDGDGRVLALDDDFIHDAGAYTPYGIILPIITAAQVPGPYRVPNYRVRFRDVYTNATPTSPYRGAGRPHACFAMERTLDAIAAELALDRIEVRRRNLIQSDQFPYEVGVAWQDGNRVIYDSGNYPALVERALQMLGPRPDGDHIGMGLSPYVEGTGVGPYEGAHVQVLGSGKEIAATGIPSQGQAHATAWAQIVADQLGEAVGDVEVPSGDARTVPWGGGTFAGRDSLAARDALAWAAGCHAAYVRVDPKTFRLEILKYVVVHDCGRLINPLVVEGQIEGGVAQGIGGAFYERLAYDADGQLRNASFMEFLMPYATEIPKIEIDHIETPSPLNPLGIKGAGEAGVIPVGAVIASAVEEALGVAITEMPLSPLKLYELAKSRS